MGSVDFTSNMEVLKMAIKSKLSILMGEKRYNIQMVCDKTGISRAAISKLYHDKKTGIDFSTLSKLCKLFGCQPTDVLEYYDEEAK